jgi:hypothetical protein
VRALGSNATALVNVIAALSEGTSKFVPDILVTSGSNGAGALDGLAATAMRYLAGNGGNGSATAAAKPTEPKGGSLPSGPAGKPGKE